MAGGGPSVGLKFDLKSWGKGVRSAKEMLRKGLDGKAATGGLSKGLRGLASSSKKTFGKMGGFLKSSLSGAFAPLLAVMGGAALFAGFKKIVWDSLESVRAYQDSVTLLNAALESTGETNLGKAREQVRLLGDDLRMSLGIGGAETNAAFAGFLTRGFDQRQAAQLTVLAANFAKKTGRPIADVQKNIADAANGGADAIKELGVEIALTGNKVIDAENAVLALKNTYGDVGADLVNPSELLNANMEQLRVSLGEGIAPLLEPLIQGVSDFVAGLNETEEGQAYIDAVVESIKFGIDWLKEAIVQTSNLVDVVVDSSRAISVVVRGVIVNIMKSIFDGLNKIPGSDFLFEKLGLDGEGMADALGEQVKGLAAESKAAFADLGESGNRLISGSRDSVAVGAFESLREQGAAAREASRDRLNQFNQATRGESFAGQRAVEETARAEAAKGAAARNGALEKQSARFNGVAEASGGMSLTINLKNKRNERFRREVR